MQYGSYIYIGSLRSRLHYYCSPLLDTFFGCFQLFNIEMISFFVCISAILSGYHDSFRIKYGTQYQGLQIVRRRAIFSSVSSDGSELVDEDVKSLWETKAKVDAPINKFTVKDFFQSLQSPPTSSLIGNSASIEFFDEIHGLGKQYLKSTNIPHLKDEAWR